MTNADWEGFERTTRPLLVLIQRMTGMETTFVTEIDWPSQRQEVVLALNASELEVAEGTVIDWSDSMCRWTFLSTKVQSVDVRADYPESVGARQGMRTFFALPILSGDAILGTVCGASRHPVELGLDTMANIRLIAEALSYQMEAYAQTGALRGRAERAEALALLDPLTGLANRRAFASRFEEELARSGRHDEPIAVLVIDLDGFKAVNDTYGHLGGDMVLMAAGEILRRAARAEDVAARLGGDEFALLMPHCAAAGAEKVAARIASDFCFATDGLDMPCTLSVGISSSETTHRRSLLKTADDALYRSKAEAGKSAGSQRAV